MVLDKGKLERRRSVELLESVKKRKFFFIGKKGEVFRKKREEDIEDLEFELGLFLLFFKKK